MARRPYDAREVANFLLDVADERSLNVTQMVLQKILYFCYGWYLLTYKEKLIKNDFEAWEYGPVIRVLRSEFKKFGNKPIRSRASRLNIDTGEVTIADANLANEDKEFIVNVFDAYYMFDAWQLSEKTHEPGSPWDKLWNNPAPVARFGMQIYDEEIRDHFQLIAKKNRVS